MRAILTALMLTVASQAWADNVLYCSTAANLATGLAEDNGRWRTYKFQDIRFSIKETGNFSSVELEEIKFSCHRPHDSERGAITCHHSQGYVC